MSVESDNGRADDDGADSSAGIDDTLRAVDNELGAGFMRVG